MSRIGKLPIGIPSGVTAEVDGQQVRVKGPRGEASVVLVKDVIGKMTDDGIKVEPVSDTQRSRAMWGLSRTLVSNIVVGVSDDLVSKFSAVDLVRAASEIVGGKGGGGRPDMAQAGGPDGAKLADAIAHITTLIDK